MQLTLKVLRTDPESGEKPYYDIYFLDADPNDRVLDLLEEVKGFYDGTLSFRRSCAHGVCGSDAMRINGRNYLACKILVRDLHTDTIVIEPILGLPVIKDLIVDMEPFFEHYRSVLPYLVNDEPLPEDGKERLQSPEQQLRYEDGTKCILCAACTTACPPFWANRKYVGPAAIVNAHRFIFDSRDRAGEQRLEILNDRDGVWRCRTVYNCTEACPRGIDITQRITEVRKALTGGSKE